MKKSYHLRVSSETEARVSTVVARENAKRKAREEAMAIPLPKVSAHSVALTCFRLGLSQLEEAERLTQEAHAGKRSAEDQGVGDVEG